MKIDPTQKNINLILKFHPLKRCKISASWNSSGLYADTITIMARKTKKTKIDDQTGAENENELLLKKISNSIQGKDNKDFKRKSLLEDPNFEKAPNERNETDNQKNNKNERIHTDKTENDENGNNKKINIIFEEEEENERKYSLDFSIENIKKKYIFPFNQTLKRSLFSLFFQIKFY